MLKILLRGFPPRQCIGVCCRRWLARWGVSKSSVSAEAIEASEEELSSTNIIIESRYSGVRLRTRGIYR